MKYFFQSILVLTLASCTSRQTKEVQANDSIVTIDIKNGISCIVPELLLSDAVSGVEIVPLEQSKNSLIGEIDNITSSIEVTSADIFVRDIRNNKILRFARDGKFHNSIGKIGNGPEEYVRMYDFIVDESKQEIYIISCDNGMKVYGYDGTFHRIASRIRIDDFLCTLNSRFIKYRDDFFVNTWIPVFRPVPNPKDSIWAFALVDSNFNIKKRFYNPSIRGREAKIVEHRSKPEGSSVVNFWKEDETAIDFYDSEFNVMYFGVDTIFRLNMEKDSFKPVYSLSLGKRPDFEMAHLWMKDRKFFDYLWISDFYETKDYIYFTGSQSEDIYAIRYDKTSGEMKTVRKDGEITERRLPWGTSFLKIVRPFILKDNVSGSGDFNVQYKCGGKYWVTVLYPAELIETVDIEALKNENVKSEESRKKLLQVFSTMKEEDNPILLIATLKK